MGIWSHQAEFSSIATQLADLAQRVEAMAAGTDEDRQGDRSCLLELERHLRAALRELDRARRG